VAKLADGKEGLDGASCWGWTWNLLQVEIRTAISEPQYKFTRKKYLLATVVTVLSSLLLRLATNVGLK
jgi:hypothetical protein